MATKPKGRPTKKPPAKSAKPAKAAQRAVSASAKTKVVKTKVARAPLDESPPAVARRPRHAQLRIEDGHADVALFAPLTEGERADALRVLLEDERLREMGKVGRYRVISAEPLVMKPPEPFAGRRLARVIIFDYAAATCVDASVDLDNGVVVLVSRHPSQPFLAAEEEALARRVAANDPRVPEVAGPGAAPQAVMHYWSRKVAELAYHRRTAAVLFGRDGARPTAVVLVDLLNATVTDVVPAAQW